MIKAVIAGLTLAVFVAAPAQAADSPCRGLENAACLKLSGCAWRNGYKTKKGVAVRAHCRKQSTPPKPAPKA
ncbi:MAG: hypothetical protein NW215_10360 [Hyphomicrobiales bacterium]|nr:hypothetical protein [Hyphomicrobiales bacterium]